MSYPWKELVVLGRVGISDKKDMRLCGPTFVMLPLMLIHCRFGAYLISEEIVQGGDVLAVSEHCIPRAS